MSSTRSYRWQSGDQIWYVCAKLLADAGFDSVSAFVDAVREANSNVLSWPDVQAGAVIVVPYLTS